MPQPRRLLSGEITYSAAEENETNILHKLGYWDQKAKFFSHLDKNRTLIQAVVAHHLGLNSTAKCRVAEQDHWLCGSFNLCIPVSIEDSRGFVTDERKATSEEELEKHPWYKRLGNYNGYHLRLSLRLQLKIPKEHHSFSTCWGGSDTPSAANVTVGV